MTYEEALRHINSNGTLTNEVEEDRVAIKIAIKALEKQKAERVISVTQFMCPFCNTRLDSDRDLNFCYECGQKLEWDAGAGLKYEV